VILKERYSDTALYWKFKNIHGGYVSYHIIMDLFILLVTHQTISVPIPDHRPTKSETLKVNPTIYILTHLPGDLVIYSNLRTIQSFWCILR
jgi:hypothetical protein